MTQLQAPIDLSSATRVGPRVYRKQVLAKRTIDYPLPDGSTQRVVFDDAYLRDLAAAYNDGAYDMVPFQLATPANQHNEDPRNYGGRVIGAEVTDDGLDLILELAEDTAELVEKTGRRLGVSARIKAVQHVDGRSFKRAIRHVLGTLDPRMQNLRPWEPVVDLAADDNEPVLDLTGYTDQEGTPMPRTLDLSTMTDEQRDALETWAALNDVDLSEHEADPEAPADDEPDMGGDESDQDDEQESDDDDEQDDDGEGVSDDELEALINAELESSDVSLSMPVGEFADPTDLSDPAEADLDLAAGLYGVQADERQAHRDENADLRFQLAAGKLARQGVPPHLIDLAAPILSLTDEQADQLDLASPATGEAIDVRRIVGDMLEAVAGTIDLSSEAGYGHETEPDEQVQSLASAWTEFIENN